MPEVNFDGLVSPCHNYSGLSAGNLASGRHGGLVSRPRDAALQGLTKMRVLADRGVAQAFFPPQLRPHLSALRRLGFHGVDQDVLSTAYASSPRVFASCSSASSMWTANAATVSPSADTEDGKVHFTPANLQTHLHRSLEVDETAETLRAIFSSPKHFAHHQALPSSPALGDEGAANHTRFRGGIHLFVHGDPGPTQFPARQTRAASEAIARLHRLDPDRVIFAQQNPKAIDAGVFHNDVISVGHDLVFLYHEEAFVDGNAVLAKLNEKVGPDFCPIQVPRNAVSIETAVKTYLFNSQLVTDRDTRLILLCPMECQENGSVRDFIEDTILNDSPITEVLYQDLRQSMMNGGGPACLRLRVELTEREIATLPPQIFFTSQTEAFLSDWIDSFYPVELTLEDLQDSHRYETNAKALAVLRGWMELPPPHC